MLRRSLRRAGARGFTIVEAVVVMAISSLLLLGAGLALQSGVKSQTDVFANDEAQADVRLLASFVQQRLPSAVLPLRQAEDEMVEFVAVRGGERLHWFIGRSCGGSASVIGGSSTEPIAAAYPPSGSATPTSGMGRLAGLAPCEEDPFLVEYLGGDGVPLTGSARLTDTSQIRFTVTPATGRSYTLEFAVGLDAGGSDLTAIPNGDFALSSGDPAMPEGWSADGAGTATLADDGGDAVAALDGPVTLTSAPFVARGDDLQVAVRPEPGAACTLEVVDDEGLVVPLSISGTPTAGSWSTLTAPMSAQAGQTRALRLVSQSGVCQFDDARTGE